MQGAPQKLDSIFGDLQVQDYLRMLIRRKLWIILPAIAFLVIATVVALRMPNVYRAETVILVDPQKVPDTYVPSTISSAVTDRLTTIQQQVLSPSRLKRLIDSMNLFPEQRGKVDDQAIVARMQRSVTVEVGNQGGRQLASFKIAYSGRNPVEVAAVTNKLASLFIEESLRSREQQSEGATEFLEAELQRTKEQLDDKEKELSRIKSTYIMDLPDSKQFHLESLSSLRQQLRASQDRVSQLQQERLFVQSQIVNTAPTIDLDAGASQSTSPFQSQIQKLQSQLSELQTRYGPSHPDVRKLQAQLNNLKARAAKEEERSGETAVVVDTTKKTHNPVLEAQLGKIEEEINTQKQSQGKLEQQIAFHTSKLEREPLFEQQIAGLMRDYDTLRTHYTSLLDKKLAAEMSSNLESRQKGERFVILDPAVVPQRPYAPNRLILMLGGLFAGIVVGVGLAFLTEFFDDAVHNETEIVKLIDKPVFGSVPLIETTSAVRKRAVNALLAVAGTAVASVMVGFVISVVTGKLL